MVVVWIFLGIVFVWYCVKAKNTNPSKPNWNKAIAAAILWPFSLFMERYN